MVAILPGAGDFHNRGYVNECLARFAGQGGFWHVVEKVLRRPTVNPQSFKKKFKDNNFNCYVKSFSGIIILPDTN